LATYFNNHAVAFYDNNGNGGYDPAAGERIYDGSYDHTVASGALNRAGYVSVQAVENAAVVQYIYCYKITITAVDAVGRITGIDPPVIGPHLFANDQAVCEMEGAP
jgi:hypothetical protein